MTKSELIEKVAQETDLSKAHTERVLESFLENIQADLASGNKVTLRGFGTFVAEERKARPGRNPRTGAEVTIPAKTVVKFKPGNVLKDAVA
ncbi:HU family DNA-binding protein [Pseudodesulfovibrio sp.]|uniref:HU family DNA-binding protein n=1 Tax=unclassified Pseudodesulfovibrio TaxID=2661612 RepID=UPI003AFF8585